MKYPHLEHVLVALSHGDFEVTSHAKQRMYLRGITHRDIRTCGMYGMIARQIDGKIQVVGPDYAGEELKIICVEEDGVVIITVF